MTTDERASLLLIGLPFGRVYPTVDVSFDEQDWMQNAYLFRGDFGETAGTASGLPYTLSVNRLHYTLRTNKLHYTTAGA